MQYQHEAALPPCITRYEETTRESWSVSSNMIDAIMWRLLSHCGFTVVKCILEHGTVLHSSSLFLSDGGKGGGSTCTTE